MIPALILHTTNNSLAGVAFVLFDGKDGTKSVIGIIAFFLITFLLVGLFVENDLELLY